jgi:biopolymer transport protein ExbB/TolQ
MSETTHTTETPVTETPAAPEAARPPVPTQPDPVESASQASASQASASEERSPLPGLAPSPTPAPRPAKDRKASRRASSDVGVLRSLALAIPFYGLAILGARSAPESAREILLERGWPPHATMVLASLAVAILLNKTFGLLRQRRAFALDLLPEGEGRIGPEDAARIVEHVTTLRDLRGRRSFLAERLVRVLGQYAARGDVGEASAANDADADADAASVAASFSTVKVIVWAMPILGLIGTVVGLSGAVGAFSHAMSAADQLDSIKDSLRQVTTGLAVAFDATFVALVASILVMLPLTWLQKAEDKLINDVDDYCVTHVLTRLGALPQAGATADQAPVATLGPAEIRSALVEALAQPIAEMLAANAKVLERMAEDRRAAAGAEDALAARIAAFTAALAQAAPAMDRAAERIERAAAQIEPGMDRAAVQIERATTDLGAGVGRAVTQLEAAASVAERAGAAAEHAQDQLARELGASRQLLSLLAAGLGAGDGAHAKPRHANGTSGANGTNGAHATAVAQGG